MINKIRRGWIVSWQFRWYRWGWPSKRWTWRSCWVVCIVLQWGYRLPWCWNRGKDALRCFCVSSRIFYISGRSASSCGGSLPFCSFWSRSPFLCWVNIGELEGIYIRALLYDSASDWHVSSEWALLVNIVSFDRFFWGFKSQTHIFPISHSF